MTRNTALPYIRSLNPRHPRELPHNWVGLLQHSLEAPDVKGIARSLANGWFRNPAAQVSVHDVSDRGENIQTFDYDWQSWGCGNGNAYVLQHEHVGYAGWSKAKWRTPTMLAALRIAAIGEAWKWKHFAMDGLGITYYPEWLKLTQIAHRSRSGILTHNDARIAWRGTTHTDPGPNFPYTEFRNMIHQELDKLLGVDDMPYTEKQLAAIIKKNTPKPLTKTEVRAIVRDEVLKGTRSTNEHIGWAVLDRDGKHPKAPIHTHDLVVDIAARLDHSGQV